jgi:hypothetical protein
MLQFSYPNGVASEQVFHLGGSVIAVLKSDDLGRRAALFSEPGESAVTMINPLLFACSQIVSSDVNWARPVWKT